MVDFTKVPFYDYSNEEICAIAKDKLLSIDSNEPIDIELLIEKNDLDLIPLAGLKRNFSIDAYLSVNKKTIYYDPDVNETRIRFSIAHEFGHFILHNKLIEDSHISNIAEWKDYIKKFPEWMWALIEKHANEFAGQILAPKENIEKAITGYSEKLKEIREKIPSDIELVRDYLAIPLGRQFGVSDQVMSIRLKRESINPYDFIV